MKEHHMDVQGAIDWTAQQHAAMVDRFNELYLQIPRWGGPVDLEVQSYTNGMAQWVVAYVQWSYESERYFGKRGLEVKKSRTIHLMPRKIASKREIGPVVVEDVF